MSWEIRQGHVLTRLREMPAESVHCVVTSPPYYGLRDYGTAQWDGGLEGCDHVEREIRTGLGLAEWSAEHAAGGGHKAGDVDRIQFRDVCGKCGARRVDEQIGLEATPEEYVAKLVDVFGEVRRVLRSDGTLWLNIGDSYSSSPPGNKGSGLERYRSSGLHGAVTSEKYAATLDASVSQKIDTSRIPGIKPKDLLGIPWLLAFALRADGWYLRSDIIWAKPNPMPESVTDRPTSAHEHVFLLSKSPRYFYDADAIREESPDCEQRRSDVRQSSANDKLLIENGYRGKRNPDTHGAGRNKRNVWEVATIPYAEAHFATFPTKLIEPCILAGSSPKACGECGAPWQRAVERNGYDNGDGSPGERGLTRTVGRHPSCFCHRQHCVSCTNPETGDPDPRWCDCTGAEPIYATLLVVKPCVVLDPFAGSGTVGVVCEWHGRDFIGIELSSEYAEMARRRIAAEGPLGRSASRPRSRDSGQLGFEL